jgi:hypothetical protein
MGLEARGRRADGNLFPLASCLEPLAHYNCYFGL